MPEKITARFNITTPMFIGDAHQEATGISPAAVKGSLRFWWRALNWGEFRNANQSDEAALKALHKREAELFGSAAEQGTGQASFKISVSANKLTQTERGATHQHFQKHDASRYLGYGLMEAFASRKKNTQAGQLNRGCLNEGQAFTVSLLSRKSIDPTIIEALTAFGLLGSLGSRSRHGLGSVSLESIQRNGSVVWEAPTNQAAYTALLFSLVKNSANTTPPYSAFSSDSRIDVLLNGLSPYQVLDGFAKRQLVYRSWGRDGRVLSQASEKRFRADHDWSKGDRLHNFHPKRVVFGLPHNYGQGTRLSVTADNYDRRSSPLIFHVHKIEGQYIGVSVLLQSDFLPKGERINAGGQRVPAAIEWSILHEFLDGSDQQGNVRFADRERVL